MNLKKKKNLATRTLKIGKERIVFVKSRLAEIKEAITKQDIRDLKQDGAIIIKEIKGRRKIKKKAKKKSIGKVKKNVKKRKQEYVKMTRKLRKYVQERKSKGEVSREEYLDIRKKIRNKKFRSKSHLKEHIGGMRK